MLPKIDDENVLWENVHLGEAETKRASRRDLPPRFRKSCGKKTFRAFDLPLFSAKESAYEDVRTIDCIKCGLSRCETLFDPTADRRICKSCRAAPSKRALKERRRRQNRKWAKAHDPSVSMSDDPFLGLRDELIERGLLADVEDVLAPGYVHRKNVSVSKTTDLGQGKREPSEAYLKIVERRKKEMKQMKQRTEAQKLTVPCIFYARGLCTKGSACPFRHGDSEGSSSIAIPCRFFLLGTCNRGSDCKFSHNIADGPRVNVAQSSLSSSPSERALIPSSKSPGLRTQIDFPMGFPRLRRALDIWNAKKIGKN